MSDVESLKAQVRELSRICQSGTPDAFEAMRELVDLLLRLTVLRGYNALRLTIGPNKKTQTLGMPGSPLVLNDGRFLRFYSVLSLVETQDHGTALTVLKNGYQYQLDTQGDAWVFRYDYDYEPPNDHPPAHIQMRATPHEDCLHADQILERLHFPTGRISLEAVIRLLVGQFRVEPNQPEDVWAPVLRESETIFRKIARQPLSRK